MGRREDIEEQLDKDYDLLKNLEDKLRTEIDPRLELRWTEDINKVKQRIHQREEELRSLSVSSAQPKSTTPVIRKQGRTRYFTEDLGNNVILDMVSIPGGSFIMGSPEGEDDDSEKPQHEVTVQPFFMGKYPVTQAQWRAIASLPKVNRDLNPEPSHFKGDNRRPVEEVSSYDAVEFCERLSIETGRRYRLPSEAEWEYACRAGTITSYHFGENITDNLVNYYRTVGQTTAVGKYPPNAFGLYDMHGNVWELCEDDWHNNYIGAPTDGRAWLSGGSSQKVLRGGSWGDNPNDCRSAYRLSTSRDFRNRYIGVRVVCVVPRTT